LGLCALKLFEGHIRAVLPQLRKRFWYEIVAAEIARHTPRMVSFKIVPLPLILIERWSNRSLLRQFGNPFFFVLFLLLVLIVPAVRPNWRRKLARLAFRLLFRNASFFLRFTSPIRRLQPILGGFVAERHMGLSAFAWLSKPSFAAFGAVEPSVLIVFRNARMTWSDPRLRHTILQRECIGVGVVREHLRRLRREELR